MAIDWDLYETRLTINGTTKKDRQINYIKNAITNDFQNSPSCRSVYINGSTTAEYLQVIDTNTDYYTKTILSEPDETFEVGDLVVFDSLTYLVTEIDEGNQIQTKGTMQLCTNTLSLYKNHILYQIPAIVFDEVRLYSLGAESNKYFSLNDDEIIVTTSNNADALNIELNDRFLIGLRNYKVLSIQDITPNGLLVIKMKVTLEDVDANLYTINILNGSSVNLHVTSTLQLHVNVYLDGDQISPTPTLTYTSSNNGICTVSSTGLITAVALGRCTITVSANGVSDTIEIVSIEAFTNNYTYKLYSTSLPDTSIRLNETKTYSARKYNNGVPLTGTFTFNVVGDTDDYKLTVIDGYTCTLKALNSGVSITLRAFENANNTNYVTKTIALKSLF